MDGLEPLAILLVEDDPADQKLIKTSLRNQKIANDVYTVQSGEEGMDFLHRHGNYSNGTPQPDLILLDLNMPGMGGKEFLRRIKGEENLKQIPVVILTTSDAERDIIDSSRIGKRNDSPALHITKQRYLVLYTFRYGKVTTANYNIRLYTNTAQFIDTMLGRFCL